MKWAVPERRRTVRLRGRATHRIRGTLREVSRSIPMIQLQHAQEFEMNWDIVEGKWKQFTGSAKENWGKLTDDDLNQAAGKRDQLVGKIQEKYGVAKDEAEKQVDSWSSKL